MGWPQTRESLILWHMRHNDADTLYRYALRSHSCASNAAVQTFATLGGPAFQDAAPPYGLAALQKAHFALASHQTGLKRAFDTDHAVVLVATVRIHGLE